MNYQAIIQKFWDKNSSLKLKPNAIALYLFLVDYSARRDWLNPIVLSQSEMTELLGIQDTTIRAANLALSEAELIDYTSGRQKIHSTYLISELPITHQIATQLQFPRYPKGHCTYLIRKAESEVYKLGITSDINQRLPNLQSANDQILSVVALSYTSENDVLEVTLQKKYKKNCILNEWFSFSEKEVSEIKEEFDFWQENSPSLGDDWQE